MSKLKYAVINDDENFVETPFCATEQEAIERIVADSDEAWEDLQKNYHVQGFTQEEITEIESRPEQ